MKKFYVLPFLIMFIFSCSQQKSSSEAKKPLSEKRDGMSLSKSADKEKFGRHNQKKVLRNKNEDETRGLDPLFVLSGKGYERYLEYEIHLTYKSENLIKAHNRLMEIIPQFGYIQKSRTRAKGAGAAYISATLKVRSSQVYKALEQCKDLGILSSAVIRSKDYTETFMLNTIKRDREKMRMRRKIRAITAAGGRSKNWVDINRSIEQSENTADRSKFEQWKIKDRIAWATVSVQVKGPSVPKEVVVPRFTDAFKDLVNIFLQFIYFIIVTSPFIVVIGLIVWKRKWLARLFKRKSRKE